MFGTVTRGSRLLAAMVAAIFAFPAGASAFTRPGDLDPNFVGTGLGTLGTVQTPMGDGSAFYASGSAVALLPQTTDQLQKIVVAGTATKSGHKVFALVRYNPDGTVDNTFGNSGVATIAVGDGDASATALLLRPDGYLVVGGTALQGSDHVFALAMFTPGGQVDTQFGAPATHTVLLPVGTPTSGARDASIQALALGTLNRVVAAGWALDGTVDKAALARFDESGDVDSTYGPSHNGVVLTDDGSGGALRAFAMLPDNADGEWVAGDSGAGGGPWALLRYDVDGNLVTRTLTPIGDGGSAHARAIMEQPTDAKLVLAGTAGDGGSNRFALARYSSSGDLDPSFGSGGKVITPIGATAGAAAVSLVLDRQIIAAGDATVGGDQGFALADYDMSGTLDPTWGSGGTVFTPFLDAGGNPVDGVTAGGAAVQADTNLVVAGGITSGPGGKFAAARYITYVPGSSGGGLQGPFSGVLGTQTSGVGGSARAGILIGRAKVLRRRGRATVRLKCVRAASFCRGRLLLRMKRRVGRHHKLRRFKVASVKFNVKSGKTGTLKLRLSHGATSVLTHKHRLRTTASAKAKDASGHTYRDAVGLTLKLRTKN
jgi:uncharacterized delta-60 repeat protein